MYQRQDLDRPWSVELSDHGIKSTIPNRAETQFEWVYFDRYVETPSLFVIIEPKRLVFIPVAKDSLPVAEQTELRELLDTHLPHRK